MLVWTARHPLVAFVVVFALILGLGLIFDGHLEVRPAIFGAIGGAIGFSLVWWRQPARTAEPRGLAHSSWDGQLRLVLLRSLRSAKQK
jgi:predicted Co/Zn/Cd cation transporter (cation efflux family)